VASNEIGQTLNKKCARESEETWRAHKRHAGTGWLELAQDRWKDEYRADLGVHRHLLAQAHAERRVDLQRLLLDGDVLLERSARLEQPAQCVLELTKFLLELTDRLVNLVHLRL